MYLDSRKGDDSRIRHLKESVIDKRGNVYRAHNDYIIKIREYNFIDQQYVQKIRNLLNYHEAVEFILNKSWSVSNHHHHSLFFCLFKFHSIGKIYSNR
jgi:hypothetical protein